MDAARERVFVIRRWEMNCVICGKERTIGDSYLHTNCDMQLNYKSKQQRQRDRWEGKRNRIAPLIVDHDGGMCKECGSTNNLTVDHINPIARGGSNDISNLQILCGSCNSRKGGK